MGAGFRDGSAGGIGAAGNGQYAGSLCSDTAPCLEPSSTRFRLGSLDTRACCAERRVGLAGGSPRFPPCTALTTNSGPHPAGHPALLEQPRAQSPPPVAPSLSPAMSPSDPPLAPLPAPIPPGASRFEPVPTIGFQPGKRDERVIQTERGSREVPTLSPPLRPTHLGTCLQQTAILRRPVHRKRSCPPPMSFRSPPLPWRPSRGGSAQGDGRSCGPPIRGIDSGFNRSVNHQGQDEQDPREAVFPRVVGLAGSLTQNRYLASVSPTREGRCFLGGHSAVRCVHSEECSASEEWFVPGKLRHGEYVFEGPLTPVIPNPPQVRNRLVSPVQTEECETEIRLCLGHLFLVRRLIE